jgi:BirA family biotin operon repressor/biotin-[acetyl-CoA-carboxylase] ligase
MSKTIRQPLTLATPLNTTFVGSRVLVYEEVTSTNDRALALGGDGLVVAADMQTAGRGRHGRSWHSEPGLGLWFSVVFEQPLAGLSFAAPLAVRDVLNTWGQAIVKWPNDVLLNGRKVCGVLVESRRNRTALGIGINVHHTEEDFPFDLRDRATSVEQASGKICERSVLFRDVLTRLDERIADLRASHVARVHAEWAEACRIVGRRIRHEGRDGVVRSIALDGALVVETQDGKERILLGEIIELDGA